VIVNYRAMLFLLPLVMLFVAAPAGAQTAQKTGYVNSAKIFQELPEAKDAETRLENFTKPVQDSLQMTQRARDFASKKDKELADRREQILTPLKDKVLKAIERVAKDEKYTFVFDQTEQVQILLYGDPNHDLTFKVIDRLKRGK
jgi:outer membrane protein